MSIKKPGFLVQGIPIKSKYKGIIVGISIILLLLNIVLPQYITALDYPGKQFVNLAIIITAVVFSIGSYATETVIIALALFMLISNLWDFGVHDFSTLRRQLLIGSIIVLFVELIIGKVGVIHLVKTLKNQFGI